MTFILPACTAALAPAQSLNSQSLAFQDFSVSASKTAPGGSGCGGGSIGSSMSVAQPSGGSVGFGDEGAARAPPAAGGFWSIKYYQPLFDVDTLQVLNRVKGSLLPRPKGAFFELVSPNPDLYGPFWIATTLIFAMAMTGNLASYIAFQPTAAKPKWTYNFNQLTMAGSVVYSYVTILPLLIWMALRYYEASKRLVDVLCIYGYTLSVFIPISVLCVIPSNLLRWPLVIMCAPAPCAPPITGAARAHMR